MRLLFVHDHRFYRDETGAVFTSGALPAPVWDRYLAYFDKVHVIGRDGGAPPQAANLAVADHPSVVFDLIKHLSYRQLVLAPRRVRDLVRAAVRSSDAVLVRLPSELGFIAAAECLRAAKPYAVEMVGCAWDGMRNHGSRAGRLYAPLFYLRTRRALRRAPRVLYVTSRWLQQRYPSRGTGYAASDVDIAPMATRLRDAREGRLRQLAEGRPPILGTVASLRIRSKGIQTAIAALELLRAEGLDLQYRVLGPGDETPWRALAAKHGVADLVSFDGTRPAGEDVRQWLDAIDVHLQPSFQEGLPRATIEAMSRGAACIGSTCGGIPELIPPERLHEPGDVRGLAERIRRLARDPALLSEASRRDLEASRAFQPERLARIRAEFLAELSAAAKKGR
jgi:glycosyltransferase involved in cell wall biosynthesis